MMVNFAGKTEIGDFECFVMDEDVLGLDIPVDQVAIV